MNYFIKPEFFCEKKGHFHIMRESIDQLVQILSCVDPWAYYIKIYLRSSSLKPANRRQLDPSITPFIFNR